MKKTDMIVLAAVCIAMISSMGWGQELYYYSTGSVDPTVTTNWNSQRNGTGTSPSDFATDYQLFYLQNGHVMTTGAEWIVSGVGLKVVVESGGTLKITVASPIVSLIINSGGTVQADAAITIGSSGTFQIDDGGTYVHNNSVAYGGSIFRGTESFDPASTVILNNSNTTGPSGVTFGNLTINFTTDPGGMVNCQGGITTTDGNLTIQNTSTREFRLTGNTALTLTVGGNLSISGGTLNMSSGNANTILNLLGNIDMSGGTLTESGTGSGTITFNGTSNQIISCSGTISNTISFTINNSSGVTLNSNLTIPGTLTLTSGKLTLGSNNLTINGPSGSISGGSASSYVVTDGTGELRCYAVGASNVLFPVGTSSTYNPVTINSSGTETYFVRVQSSFDNAPPEPNKVVNRQWTITNAPDGGTTATITLQWNSSDEAGGFDRDAAISIGRHNGSQWVGTSVTLGNPSSGVYTATASGFTFFSPFAVGNEGAVPIELASFTARARGSTVELKWATATEVNNFGFDVERNAISLYDGWKKIGFVEGHGTSNTSHQYSYVDRNLTFGKYSYRLKQIDRDGKFSYSPRVEVSFQPAIKYRLWQNYPNPFNPKTRIEFSLPTPGKVRLAIYNVLGEEVAVLVDEVLEAGIHARDFHAANLSSGIYFYRLVAGGKVLTNRMTVIK